MNQKTLRTRLESELERALQRTGATRETIASVMGAGCRIDGVGAAAVEPGLADAEARLQRRVRELARALDRLDRSEHGRCDACGAEIDPERLAVAPATVRCRACAT